MHVFKILQPRQEYCRDRNNSFNVLEKLLI